MGFKRDALDYHSEGRAGKLEIVPIKPLHTQRDLSLAYTPGVAEPCLAIHKRPDDVYRYTTKGNCVAVVTNGTAVLGLGNIGPMAGKPVMEGKCNLFKKFADIDAIDIELDARTPQEVIAAVKAIAPTFGGINLEDIKSPDCFVVEKELQAMLDIPVFHDDQHGTAIIAAAGLINACLITGRKLEDIKVVFSGAGAAAVATALLLESLGVRREHIWMTDSEGLLYKGRKDHVFPEKMRFAQGAESARLAEVLVGKDVFIGLSVGGVLKPEMLQKMAPRPIIFAMANPEPEIHYHEAKAAVPDAIVATGRSDYPNQVNNVLGFPFVFRGALDCRARAINESMKRAAVYALAELAREDVPDEVLDAYKVGAMNFGPDYIIPKPFDPRVLLWVAPAVARAAAESGVAREPIADIEAYRARLERKIERSKEVLRPVIARAQRSPRRVVFPDGTHPRVLRAAQILVEQGICKPILVGDEWRILKRAEETKLSLEGIEIVSPGDGERLDSYAERLYASRQRKGMTRHSARQWLRRPVYYGAMMVETGDADGMVGGIEAPYAETVRPALQLIGHDPGVSVVSGVYVMLFKNRVFFLGDCTVNILPPAAELAQIALNTARLAQSLGYTPRVAMLSYSDFGEHRDNPEVTKIPRAIEIVREAWPQLVIDGEMQADSAVNAEMAARDFSFSRIQGDANVLVFPGLASGNIAYKLLRELGGATAVGPVIMGLRKPVNVLALGASVNDIVHIAAITVHQAQALAAGE
ncbi:MAG: NADP-dependent malic enzyme [Deltaproteobacteria bacterium]|nr:NADP-dependent malic enzyme [Deltaproteobacteria bacterium]